MSVTFADGVTVTFGVAFGKNPGDTVADGDYTDLSAYVRDFSINRGRASERDTFQTGTAAVVLANKDRRFDPEYASSPYVGNLLPLKHARIQITRSAVTYTLFKGYVEGWPQTWEDNDHNAWVTLTIHDAFALIAGSRLPSSPYVAEVLADNPVAWYRLGEQDGTVMLDSSGNGRHGTYANGAVFNTRDGLIGYDDNNSIEFSAATKRYGATPFTFNGLGLGSVAVEFWWNSTATTEVTSTILGAAESPTSISAGAGTYFYVSVPDTGVASGKFFFKMISPGASGTVYSSVSANTGATKHVVICSRNGSPPIIYVNGVDVSTGATSGSGVVFTNLPPLFVASANNWASHFATGTIDEVAIYDGELSSARVLAHYNAGANGFSGETVETRITRVLGYGGLSAIPTSLDASTQTVQACDFRSNTDVLSYLQLLEESENGQARLFISASGTLTFHSRYHDEGGSVATAFDDTSSTLPYEMADYEYDHSRVLNDVTVQREGGTVQRATNDTSITTYRYRGANVSGLLVEADSTSQALADFLVARYATASPRVPRLIVNPRRAPATLYPVVGGREIGDRVSVARKPVKLGSAWTKTLTIEGISHAVDKDKNWTTTFLTAPVDPLAVGRWDSGVWDTATWGI